MAILTEIRTRVTIEEYMENIKDTVLETPTEGDIEDIFIAILRKDGELAFIGQSLTPSDPHKIITALERIKRAILDACWE